MKPDYSILDRPEALAVIFHPRPELTPPAPTEGMSDHLIPVAPDVAVGARFFATHPDGANLLFFHGNGEIVADYDDLGTVYKDMDINFMAADYRGYGRSSGHPTANAMLADSHIIFNYLLDWLKQNGFNGPLIVMGRSLGSAAALEIAAGLGDKIDGLIIESGFAYTAALLKLLGIDPDRIGFREDAGFSNLDKIAQFVNPTLIIHAEFDHIIPFSDAEALLDRSAGQWKRLLTIEGANHNDILMRGFTRYLQAIKELTDVIGMRPSDR